MLVAIATLTAIGAGASLSSQAANQAIDVARAAGVSESRMWQLLLHYESTAAGGVESRADGAAFFLHPNGKVDAAGELRATLTAFFAPVGRAGDEDQHALCRFPARRAYLVTVLGSALAELPRPRCRAYDAWIDRFDAGRVTVVFAAAYLNSPPSMFGHTLLRIDRRDALDDPLLSTAINYAAAPNTGSFPLYALRGLTGGLPGAFSVAPYYIKVREYSNLEARDLWEYQLSLTPEQITRLLAHTWELSQTHFEYYFLTENCSFHLLSLLEVAVPSLHLSERFRLVTLPADTIRAFAGQPGLVARRVFRPSQTSVMNALRGLLSAEEVTLVEDLVTATTPRFDLLAGHPPARQALILDAAHDYLERLRGAQRGGSDFGDRELTLLELRSTLPAVDSEPRLDPAVGPDDAHDSSRIDVAVGIMESGRVFEEIGWRPLLHDLLDRPGGYAPTSAVELLAARFRIEPQRFARPRRHRDVVVLDRLDLVRITSLTPRWAWNSAPSWRMALGAGRVVDLGCRRWDCVAADLEGGIGYTLATRILGGEAYYGFVGARLSAGPAFDPAYRIGAGATAGLLLQPIAALSLQAEVSYRFDIAGDVKAGRHVFDAVLRVNLALHRDVALRLEAHNSRDTREAKLGLLIYFD